MSDDIYVHAGGLIMFSSGEYSDYTTRGCFVALETLTRSRLSVMRDAVNAEFKRLDVEHDDASDAWEKSGRMGDYPRGPEDVREMFTAALIKAGLLLSVTYTELHLGSYGELELGL